jgi:hypothetical protein
MLRRARLGLLVPVGLRCDTLDADGGLWLRAVAPHVPPLRRFDFFDFLRSVR